MQFCGQAPSAREEGFQVENVLANLGVVLQKSEGFSPIHLLGLQVFLRSETRAPIELTQDLINSQRMLLTVHSVQVDLQQRFPICQLSSVYQAAGINRG